MLKAAFKADHLFEAHFPVARPVAQSPTCPVAIYRSKAQLFGDLGVLGVLGILSLIRRTDGPGGGDYYFDIRLG